MNLTLKELQKELSNYYFAETLRYTPVCLIKLEKPQAWLIPPDSKPDIVLVGSISTKQLKGQTYYWIDQLAAAQAKFPNVVVGYALLAPGSGHISTLVAQSIDLKN
jgi:hypothetical protein